MENTHPGHEESGLSPVPEEKNELQQIPAARIRVKYNGLGLVSVIQGSSLLAAIITSIVTFPALSVPGLAVLSLLAAIAALITVLSVIGVWRTRKITRS